MLIFLLFIFLVSIIYVVFNHKNLFSYFITVYLIDLIAMTLISVLYMSKITLYRHTSDLDLALYIFLSQIPIKLDTLVAIRNSLLGFFLFISTIFPTVYLYSDIRKKRNLKLLILQIIPIMVFIILNLPDVDLSLYFLSFKHPEMFFFRYAEQICDTMSILIMITYMIMPYVRLIHYYFKTKIISNRTDSVAIMISLLIVDIYVIYAYILGPFKDIIFYNVDSIHLPKNPIGYQSSMFLPMIFLIMALMLFYIVMHYKPLKFNINVFNTKPTFMKSRVGELSNNLGMNLHVYKNALLCVNQQLELSKKSINVDKIDRALEHIENGIKITVQYRDLISKTISSISNCSIKHSKIYLEDCIEEALSNLTPDENISIEFISCAEKNLIIGDKQHLTEVFTNMLINSVDAIKAADREHGIIKISILKEGHLVDVSIYDNGCGIKKNYRKKIFEPFFSTKPSLSSSGIGLSYVYNVVKQHGGIINVKSKFNEFTDFHVTFNSYTSKLSDQNIKKVH